MVIGMALGGGRGSPPVGCTRPPPPSQVSSIVGGHMALWACVSCVMVDSVQIGVQKSTET